MTKLTAIILAAGKGTRMESSLPKVLHKVCGCSMLEHVLNAAEAAGCRDNVVVLGHGAELVREIIEDSARIVLQKKQLGTGHAALQAADILNTFTGTVMILCGDTPLLEAAELRKFYEEHIQSGATATIMTAMMDEPFGYGRILRDENGNVTGIVEDKDATNEQKQIKEINAGIYCVEAPLLFEVLQSLTNKNRQGEYYLTDIVATLCAMGKKVGGVVTADAEMIMGVNTRQQLAEAEKIMQRRIQEKAVASEMIRETAIEKLVAIGAIATETAREIKAESGGKKNSL
ncbi:MAG: NTP transferase domain-containing protein [Acidaminococcaceae bacterium]|nr:NTP transferase domain-containing protein [Acidaminococcaceae bacterium]